MFKSGEGAGGVVSSAIERREFARELPLFNGSFPAEHHPRGRNFDIHMVDTAGQQNLACELLNRMYGWRGYGADHKLSDSNESSTFAASVSGEIVGTLTLTVDSPSGLAADKTFGDVLDEARAQPGANLCELTKFASQPSSDSKHLLASMFHTIFVYGTERYGCTDLFIEVNPRHMRFYQTMLGFAKVGGIRTNKAVDAPSQLMRLKVSDISKYIEFYARCDNQATVRSLYPLFFSPEEEERVRFKVNANFASPVSADLRIANSDSGGWRRSCA